MLVVKEIDKSGQNYLIQSRLHTLGLFIQYEEQNEEEKEVEEEEEEKEKKKS